MNTIVFKSLPCIIQFLFVDEAGALWIWMSLELPQVGTDGAEAAKCSLDLQSGWSLRDNLTLRNSF